MREGQNSKGVERRGKPEKCDFIYKVGNGPSVPTLAPLFFYDSYL